MCPSVKRNKEESAYISSKKGHRKRYERNPCLKMQFFGVRSFGFFLLADSKAHEAFYLNIDLSSKLSYSRIRS